MKKVAILNDTSNVPHHGCGIVSSCLSELLLNNNFEVIDINPCEKNWRLNKKFIKNLQMTDVVIVNGEGTLHHSQKIAMELIKIGKYYFEFFEFEFSKLFIVSGKYILLAFLIEIFFFNKCFCIFGKVLKMFY